MTARDGKRSPTVMRRHMATAGQRRPLLRRLLASGATLRMLEAHSGLSGLIVESVEVQRGTAVVQFDGIWFSSLTNSAVKGHPDDEALDLTARLETLSDLLAVTTKPIIYDADTGGDPERLASTAATLEQLGVSAVIVEDKGGPKRNSLSLATAGQSLQDAREFCRKIRAACDARRTNDFLVIARVESLIVGAGVADALHRAHAYVAAGADGVMIHSRASTAEEVLAACRRFHAEAPAIPLVAVPSTYPQVSESELAAAGVRIVIYANQLLRSAYPAMTAAARTILEHGRALEAERFCMTINDVLHLVGEGRAAEDEG